MNELTPYHTSPFDAIRQINENGQEYWSARDLQTPLGYAKWQNFEEVIDKGKISCKNNGYNPDDHFTDVSNPIKSGKGGIQYIQDCHLTRLACYFTAMNGDPRKPEIAAAQGYFVVSTRENEIAKVSQQLTTNKEMEKMIGDLRKELRDIKQLIAVPEQQPVSRDELKKRVLEALKDMQEDYPDGLNCAEIREGYPWFSQRNHSIDQIYPTLGLESPSDLSRG